MVVLLHSLVGNLVNFHLVITLNSKGNFVPQDRMSVSVHKTKCRCVTFTNLVSCFRSKFWRRFNSFWLLFYVVCEICQIFVHIWIGVS